MLLALLLAADASAFCGYYAGGAGAEIFNRSSQVAIVRQGTRTTLTMAADVEGDVSDFGLVIPVPAGLAEEDVRVVSPDVFTALDAFSAPRAVYYPADTGWRGGGGRGGCSGGIWCRGDAGLYDYDTGGGDALADQVTVEAQFAAGAYEIVLLSATSGDPLVDWMNANGFVFSEEAGALFDSYLEGGSWFLAAKVALSAPPSIGGAYLQPIQIAYDADALVLPIRIGTLSGRGAQDVIVYGLTEAAEGGLAITTYPEVNVQTDCVLPDELGAWYVEALDAAVAAAGGAGWIREYALEVTPGQPAQCDPCTDTPPAPENLSELGWSGERPFLTRMHARYAAEAAHQDLVFGPGPSAAAQIRYISDPGYLGDSVPTCSLAEPAPLLAPAPAACAPAMPAPGYAGVFALVVAALRRRR